MEKVGFVGLGIMGLPMAKRVLDAGYTLRAFDINRESQSLVCEYGAEQGSSPEDVARHCNVVITMLPDSPEVEKVVTGQNGLVDGFQEGATLIDMSSISPIKAQEIASKLAAQGIEMLDAPVSGGQEKAENGMLAIMVGGKRQVFDQWYRLLESMGNSITFMGDIGAGQTTKLVNQIIVAINIAAIAEGLVLGKRAGVDPALIFDAIKGGLAGSQCLADKAPRMLTGRYEPGFRIGLHTKDLRNALETSRHLGLAMPLSAQIMEMMSVLFSNGHDKEDHAALGLFYEQLNNVSLREGNA